MKKHHHPNRHSSSSFFSGEKDIAEQIFSTPEAKFIVADNAISKPLFPYKMLAGIFVLGASGLGLVGCYSNSPNVAASVQVSQEGDVEISADPSSEMDQEKQTKEKGKKVSNQASKDAKPESLTPIHKPDAYWKEKLSDQEYYVTRQKGTERSHTGRYWDNKKPGTYRCVCCGLSLFDSNTKYKSGTGWPSFYQPVHPKHVTEKLDKAGFLGGFWMGDRTEIVCTRCDAHLGHVFDDGPQPTGKRYCMNSAALKFEEREASKD